ncbi:glycoside hydrolase family 9 protein [Chitinispirillales bacterium ANBcel5]|uniref:glycoside hydrolase family 9 protein n=1 Tax=Cellulosispirillum alkaliphilum TaxID=3039283 RepID=UPI002A50A1D4|nr:glycoside hydrolase family 9 protein [Chitinispirillales bacterium ANBcel5]
MKKSTFLSLNIVLVVCMVFLNCVGTTKPLIDVSQHQICDSIRFNQVGYLPSAPKYFMVADSRADTFYLIDTLGVQRYRGLLGESEHWHLSGESVAMGEFSSHTEEGVYHIYVPLVGISAPFEIGREIYQSVLEASLKSFYFQRASLDLEPRFAGQWAREAGHPDTACKMHPSTGATGYRSSPGGWYDAGDFGKYVVNSGITVATLLSLYERFPDVIGDKFSYIPESGNGTSDLLDEVKYQLDWLKTMQDDDGGVFFKLSGLNWPGTVMPHEDTQPRYIIGKSTTSTLCFAANMAQAARIYRKTDREYADDCLERAKNAFAWAMDNPAVPEPEETGGSGAYGVWQQDWMDPDCSGEQYLVEGDDAFKDEFFLAATELFITTGDKQYGTMVRELMTEMEFRDVPTWWDLQGLAYYSLLTADNTLEQQYRDVALERVLNLSDHHMEIMSQNPYRIPYECFFWGSNASFLNIAILFSYAYTLSGEIEYFHAMAETMDYIFGKNATGYCFVTGFGHKSSTSVHHRQINADGIDEPIPGFVAGGPNAMMQDCITKVDWGAKYPYSYPARAYVNDKKSYASNEVAINWTAPMVHALGFLMAAETP